MSAVAALLLACAGGPPAEPLAEETRPPRDWRTPEASALFAAHLEAIGGESALMARSASQTRGTVQIVGQQIVAPFEVHRRGGYEFRSRVMLPGGVVLERGFDGARGWARDPGGRLLYGAELAAARCDADFYAALRPAERLCVAETETVGREDFAGQDAWRVRLLRPWGDEDTAWFSVETGLLIGRSEPADTRDDPEVTVLSDYREVGGLLVAHARRWSQGDLEMRFQIEEHAWQELAQRIPLPASLEPAGHGEIPIVRAPIASEGLIRMTAQFDDPAGGEAIALTMALDTGATCTVVDPAAWARIAPPEAGAALAIDAEGLGGSIGALDIRPLPPLRLGERVYGERAACVLDLSHVDDGRGPIDGILGVDLLSQHAIAIDRAAGTIALHPADDVPSVFGLRGIPLETFGGGLYRLDAQLDGAGAPFPALLDTGAVESSLNWMAAAPAGAMPGGPGVRRSGELRGADDRPVFIHEAELPALYLGGASAGDGPRLVGDLPVLRYLFDGQAAMILGLDLLSERAVLDLPGGELWVAPAGGL